jgi:hypothetical protein
METAWNCCAEAPGKISGNQGRIKERVRNKGLGLPGPGDIDSLE